MKRFIYLYIFLKYSQKKTKKKTHSNVFLVHILVFKEVKENIYFDVKWGKKYS